MSLDLTPLRSLPVAAFLGLLVAVAGCYGDDGALVDERWTDDSYEERAGLSPADAEDDANLGDDPAYGLDAESAEDGDLDESGSGLATEPLSAAIEPTHGRGESEAKGLIDAPEEVAVFVGEILEVDLFITDPSLGNLLPAALPERAVFEPLATGGRVRWQPGLEDIGTHDFVFLIVDADEPSLVVAQQTMIVDVLPRFSLVEYGF